MIKKLWKGIRVEIKNYSGAGAIYIHRVDMLSNVLTCEVAGGRPYAPAYDFAEQLAITADAEFVVTKGIIHEIKRYSLSGEYKEFEEKK